MVPEFVVFVLMFIASYLAFKLVYTKTGKNCDEASERKRQQLRPLPKLSIIKAIVWLVFVGKFRMTKGMRYVGRKGKIIDFKFWRARAVIINDLELAKQLFRNPIFCGRETNAVWHFMSLGSNGVLNSTGKKWIEQKKFCYQHLKEFGFSTKSMESIVQHEVDELIENWAKKKGEAFSPNKCFYYPVLNSIWIILAGEKASSQDQQLFQLVQPVFDGFAKITAYPEAVSLFSKFSSEEFRRLIEWTPFLPGLKFMRESLTQLHSYFRTVIEARKGSIDLYENPRNLVDAYIKQINETTDPNSEFFQQRGETNLMAIMTEFFLAGGDTTATQLVWAMLRLIRHPEIQEQIQKEIATIVGNDRRLSLQDRINCPFTEAFIWEVLRCNPLSTVSLPHAATEDTTIGPYFIEKETILGLNIYYILNDPVIWGDPENFRPDRFLSADGKTVIKHDAMCAFSIGLRRCFGEQLARDELFLFIGSICQRFHLKPDPLSKTLPTLHEEMKLLLIPKKFNMIAIDRLACSA